MAKNKADQQTSEAARQLEMIFRSLDNYGRGAPNITTLGSQSVTAPSGSDSNPKVDPVKVNSTQQQQGPTNTRSPLGMAPSVLSLAAALAKDPQLAQAAGLMGLANQAAKPNANIESLAPSFLGQVGSLTQTPVLGQIATALGIAQNGLSTPSIMGILGMVNPTIGLAGLMNSIAGNPIGNVFDTLRNSLVSNPNSINSLAASGVSTFSQAYNSVNDRQVNDYDTEGMDRLAASFSGSSERNGGNNRGGGNSSAQGTGNTSTSGANSTRTGGDSRNSY